MKALIKYSLNVLTPVPIYTIPNTTNILRFIRIGCIKQIIVYIAPKILEKINLANTILWHKILFVQKIKKRFITISLKNSKSK